MSNLYDTAYSVGKAGGTMDTNGLSSPAKQIVDKGVNDGKAGK